MLGSSATFITLDDEANSVILPPLDARPSLVMEKDKGNMRKTLNTSENSFNHTFSNE